MNFLAPLFIGKYAKYVWPAIIVSLIVLKIYSYWDGRNDLIRDLKNEKSALETELVIRKQEYESNLKTLRDSIADQNAMIADLNDQLIKAEQHAEQQIAIVNTKNQALSDKLQEQLDLINSIDTPKTCQQAIDLLIDVAIQHPWPTERK